MEKNINLAKILNGKPVNTKLWSPLFGDVYTSSICSEDTIIVVNHHAESSSFYNNGKYFDHAEAEPLLFPSKEMRDWNKFAWKKGDVLISNDGKKEVFFNGFTDDTYALFKAKHGFEVLSNGKDIYLADEDGIATSDYTLEDKDVAQTYINTIEKRLGGKLNRETLEIENQPEFKDGDIVCISGMGYLAYGIVKSIDYSSKKLDYYVLNDMSTLNFEDWLSFEDKHIQPITETQQIILFDALEKEGKAWDAEKKQIVDLKPKVELKPFDKVLSRRCSEDYWVLNFYSHKTDYYHICIDGSSNLYCIPYNEETAHLLGTTDEWKGGEG
nr:MAG TPA: hypothetical protein [Caudoviricetes sp.]